MHNFKKLEKQIGYSFNDVSLLKTALTHSSFDSTNNNERLEFLGDAVLNLVVSNQLYNIHLNSNEGDLSVFRAGLICKEEILKVAFHLPILELLIIDQNIKNQILRSDVSSLISDAFEAIVGAIYLDSNFNICYRIICHLYEDRIANIVNNKNVKDPKNRLQEYLQQNKLNLPKYVLDNIELDGNKQIFHMKCIVQFSSNASEIEFHGSSTTKRKAEKEAAINCLNYIENIA